jgi:hypothetical protein
LKKEVKKYMSKIGKAGGKKSKRELSTEQARKMVDARETKRKKAR